jgi:hypothetical protein
VKGTYYLTFLKHIVLVHVISPVEVEVGVLAVDFGDKLTNESTLVKGRVVGTEEVIARSEEAVMVNLKPKK